MVREHLPGLVVALAGSCWRAGVCWWVRVGVFGLCGGVRGVVLGSVVEGRGCLPHGFTEVLFVFGRCRGFYPGVYGEVLSCGVLGGGVPLLWTLVGGP